MRVTSKGQVTIPLPVREKLGIQPNTEVDFQVHGNTVRLVKVTGKRTNSRGVGAVAKLKGSANVKMSTDQILALTRASS